MAYEKKHNYQKKTQQVWKCAAFHAVPGITIVLPSYDSEGH